MTLPALPEQLLQRGGDPRHVGDELRHYIDTAITQHPRSLQTRIGPSELGHPCTRRLGYKLAGVTQRTEQPSDGWLPTIGTAVHTWLEHALQQANDTSSYDRFYLEERVTVGQVDGAEITGSCDVYDRVTATVIDWKVVGEDKLRRYRLDGPGEQYRRQAHLYGKGFENIGLPVDTVMIAFLPRGGALSSAHYWHEPYDRAVAVETLHRANTIAQLVRAGGPAVLSSLPTTSSYCTYCPWFRRGSTDLATGCPGDTDAAPAAAAMPTTLAGALGNDTENRKIA